MASRNLARATARPLPVALEIDGTASGAETLLTDVGLALVLETAVPRPDVPIQVTSSYVAAPSGALTQITHAVVGHGRDRTEHVALAAADIPVLFARSRCLEHHLMRVLDLLAEMGQIATLPAIDAALAAADAA